MSRDESWKGDVLTRVVKCEQDLDYQMSSQLKTRRAARKTMELGELQNTLQGMLTLIEKSIEDRQTAEKRIEEERKNMEKDMKKREKSGRLRYRKARMIL